MSTDPESFQKDLLAWLMQDPVASALPDEEASNSTTSSDSSPYITPAASQELAADSELENPEVDAPHPLGSDPLDVEGMGFASNSIHELEDFSPHSGSQSVKPGEIPTVQERFHALLKHRLQTEIQRHPPLFPWETEVASYESDIPDFVVPDRVPARLWAAQLRNLSMPVPVPEAILTQLLEQCQEVVQTSLKEGVKLVRAVEALFPDQSQTLNDLAGLVLVAPHRSGTTSASLLESDEATAQFPESYEVATLQQQMLLSLLAAREIMESLNLAVVANQPTVERQWLTSAGLLTLETKYQPQGDSRLRIQGRLPCGGSLKLKGDQSQSTTSRSQAGCLSVELFDPQPNQSYTLEVRLQEQDQKPLIFTVQPVAG